MNEELAGPGTRRGLMRHSGNISQATGAAHRARYRKSRGTINLWRTSILTFPQDARRVQAHYA